MSDLQKVVVSCVFVVILFSAGFLLGFKISENRSIDYVFNVEDQNINTENNPKETYVFRTWDEISQQITDSWLTSRNDEYGFEIKYPPNWTFETSKAKEDGSGTLFIIRNPQKTSTGEGDYPSEYVSVTKRNLKCEGLRTGLFGADTYVVTEWNYNLGNYKQFCIPIRDDLSLLFKLAPHDFGAIPLMELIANTISFDTGEF